MRGACEVDGETTGLPLGMAVDARGALRLADPPANAIWRVDVGDPRRA